MNDNFTASNGIIIAESPTTKKREKPAEAGGEDWRESALTASERNR